MHGCSKSLDVLRPSVPFALVLFCVVARRGRRSFNVIVLCFFRAFEVDFRPLMPPKHWPAILLRIPPHIPLTRPSNLWFVYKCIGVESFRSFLPIDVRVVFHVCQPLSFPRVVAPRQNRNDIVDVEDHDLNYECYDDCSPGKRKRIKEFGVDAEY